MAIEIQDLRLTFIWADTTLEVLAGHAPAGSIAAQLSRRPTYGQLFNALQQGQIPHGLQLPWPRQGRQFFWIHYLNCRTLDDLNGDQAWKMLLPLRHNVRARIRPPDTVTHFIGETYLYPYGLALVLSMHLERSFSLDEAVTSSLQLRRGLQFELLGNGGVGEPVSLDMLGDRLLRHTRQTMYGVATDVGVQATRPFTVVTVVKANNVDPTVPLEENGDIHRALDAWAAWSPTWQYDQRPSLIKACVPLRTRAPLGHTVYGGKRGRVVWFPAHFLPQSKPIHALNCYHRNLAFLSLQIESLANFVVETAQRLQANQPLSNIHEQYARYAVGILGRLYGGAETTYQSRSACRHIEDNAWVDAINSVRSEFGMENLKRDES